MCNLSKLSIIFILLFTLFFTNPVIAIDNVTKVKLQQAYNANQQKRYDKAIELTESVLNNDPKNYQALCILGITYGNLGNSEKAIDAFTKASKYNPNQWSALSFLGDIYMQKGAYYIAEQYYQKVIEKPDVPTNTKLYFEKRINICKQNLAKTSNVKNLNINVVIPFNPSEWHIAGLSEKNGSWNAEYSYKNEKITNGQWSKLITINYINKPTFKIDKVYSFSISNLEKIAESLHKDFKYTLISQNEMEIVYKWDFENGQEAEIARIIQYGDDIYHLHYAQKSTFSEEEASIWLKTLMNSKIK